MPAMRSLYAPAAISALALAAILCSSCYVTSQGLRYLSIRSGARSVDRELADPRTGAEQRALLERARDVRAFAASELGLKETKSYTTIVRMDSDRLATVVQACAELSFDRWLWSYPFVGKLPYRGYFDPADAEKEAARLRKKGLDVIARPVDAFSTLGYLSDPLFSFMSSYDESEVADLVIHEMTHATVFLKGRGLDARTGERVDTEQFNEELATFVGREGSLLYLAEVHGPGSAEVEAARAARRDAEAYAAFLRGTAGELELIYSSGATEAEKREGKARAIASRAALFAEDYDRLFETEAYRKAPMDRINNAYLDLYRLYEGESSLYRDFYLRVSGGDMKAFIASVSRIAKEGGDPKESMRRELDAAGGAAAREEGR
jgi:predicted aminopeptidase